MTDNEEDQKNQKTIWLKFLGFVVFIITFIFCKGCTHALLSSIHNPKNNYTQEEIQLVKDAAFVKGFEFINTSELETFCTDTGYVPEIYINEFKKQFSNTITNADKIYNKYLTQKDKNIIYEKYIKNNTILEDDFKEFNTKYDLTKKEYCKLFDDAKDEILQEKIKIFLENRPNMYHD